MAKCIGLRVDVDFEIGLVKGVPFLLDFFAQKNIKATFYVTMGPDGFRHSRKRIKSRGYIKRIIKLNPLKIILGFGPSYLIQQFLGISGNVGKDHPEILTRIISEGHELGVHGYDHFWWAENIWDCKQEALENDINEGLETFREITGSKATAWASPNWRCSKDSLELIEKYNFTYGADCRGETPFYPKSGNWHGKIIQVPITLPCLHELTSYLGSGSVGVVENSFMSSLNDSFNVWCIHCYYEGILERKLFASLTENILINKYNFIPIRDLLSHVNCKQAPSCEVIRKCLPGGRGAISYQETL